MFCCGLNVHLSVLHDSLIPKIVDLFLGNIAGLWGSQVFNVGDVIFDRLEQNFLSSSSSKFLHFNGMTQPLKIATRINTDSATLIDHVFHNHFFDNTDCGMLDAGATFVHIPFFCKKYDDTATTYKVFPLF